MVGVGGAELQVLAFTFMKSSKTRAIQLPWQFNKFYPSIFNLKDSPNKESTQTLWWYLLVTLALGRQRQALFKAMLVCVVPGLPGLHREMATEKPCPKKIFKFNYEVQECLPTCVCICPPHAYNAHAGQKTALDTLELQLQSAVSCHVSYVSSGQLFTQLPKECDPLEQVLLGVVSHMMWLLGI